MIRVYHIVDARRFVEATLAMLRDRRCPLTRTEVLPVLIADQAGLDFEAVYRRTNHVDEDWAEFWPDALWVARPARSTSMGDVIEIDGVLRQVAMVGFVPFVWTDPTPET